LGNIINPGFVCDATSLNFHEVHPLLSRYYGYSRSEFLKMSVADLCLPEHAAGMAEFCHETLFARKRRRWQYEREFQHRTKSGKIIDVEIDASRIVHKGKPALLLTVRDISKRKRAARRLRAQLAVSEALAEATTVAEASPKIFQAICENLGCDWGELWRVDPDGRLLRCVQVWHSSAEKLPELEAITHRATFMRGKGLPGLVWARNRPVWIKDLTLVPILRRGTAAPQFGLRAGFAMPIRLGNEVLGVISVFSREVMNPDKALLQLLKSISNQIGQMMGRRRIERRLLEVAEHEQERIAQDLHDGISQQLAGIAYLAKDLRDRLNEKQSPEVANVARIAELLDVSIQQTRQLARGLNPVKPVSEGLTVALQELAATVQSLFSIDCRFSCPRPVIVYNHTAANHLYRIAQEAIHNAITHGKASEIVIALEHDAGALRLSISDNGKGVSREVSQRAGLGLEFMRHRARSVGGECEVNRKFPRGTVVTCSVPAIQTGPS
jgi:PAS domain S-box-containing protein